MRTTRGTDTKKSKDDLRARVKSIGAGRVRDKLTSGVITTKLRLTL